MLQLHHQVIMVLDDIHLQIKLVVVIQTINEHISLYGENHIHEHGETVHIMLHHIKMLTGEGMQING
jgi:hypothetical protein